MSSKTNMVVITGTSTAVGKTVMTALMLAYARSEGSNTIAMKPVASGGREDAEVLWSLQSDAVTLDETNPFHFKRALAPILAARAEGRARELGLRKIVGLARELARKKGCECLLMEGCGGLLSPFGDGFNTLDLVLALNAGLVIVGKNELGVINHVLLTLRAWEMGLKGQKRGWEERKSGIVVLMGGEKEDDSCATNAKMIKKLGGVEVVKMPFLGQIPGNSGEWIGAAKDFRKILKKTLARSGNCDTLISR